MDWRDEYKKRLVSAEDAVRVVRSGDRVVIPLAQQPDVLATALAARKDELKGVEILQGVTGSVYPWYQPGYEEAFTINCAQYTGPRPRPLMWERRGDFTPVTYAMEFKDIDERRPGCIDPDVCVVVVSPPNEHGFCSFGESLWEKKEYVKRAKVTLAEVNAHLIRTHGDNFVHVSEIDHFVEATPYEPTPEELEEHVYSKMPDEIRDRFKTMIAEVSAPSPGLWRMKDSMEGMIAILGAEGFYRLYRDSVLGAGDVAEHIFGIAHYLGMLIHDGDCIQIGTGNTSNPLVRAGVFEDKQDLGFHCETAPPGIPSLVYEGVFTGRYKNIDQGKAVCTSFWPCSSQNQRDLDILNENPLIELYGSHYTNNASVIAANDNHVSINNALYVDLTGQIASETIPGFLLYNGPGGQMDWVIGALNSKGGRSVTVLPSMAVGGSISRIAPLMEEGIMVTVPRTYADFIVTEHGIASLLGKSQRKRADELIAVAHPDHRAELRKEAQRLFYP